MANDILPIPIKLSEVERLRKAGYIPLENCDAAKANSDYLLVMVKRNAGVCDVKILCPTFLRGPLGVGKVTGSFSY